MEIKDIVTVSLSSAAFILSLVSTLFSLKQKGDETRRSIREKLNQTIVELGKLGAEMSVIGFKTNQGLIDKTNLGILNQRSSILARQAVFLIEQEPDIVTDVEYATVAQALDNIGDYEIADSFWNKAVEASPRSLYKIYNLRAYAEFLYRLDNPAAGRQKYQQALTIFDESTDFKKYQQGYTHQMQMGSEFYINDLAKAEECYQAAQRIFERIANVLFRDSYLKDLALAKGSYMMPTESNSILSQMFSPPGNQPDAPEKQ